MEFAYTRRFQPQNDNITKHWVLDLLVEEDTWGRNHLLSTRQDEHTLQMCANYEDHNMLKLRHLLNLLGTLHACNLRIHDAARPAPKLSSGISPPQLSVYRKLRQTPDSG